MLREELDEYAAAAAADDVVAVADALADLAYVLYGTALVHGIPLDEVFEEVHRSNLTKADGRRAGSDRATRPASPPATGRPRWPPRWAAPGRTG
jgi:predicted HAD superfamily Cof-like phosphohydrolase